MAVFKNQTIRKQRIILDNNTYDGCILEDCEIVYRGGEVRLNFSTTRCSWSFEGPALNTIRMLQHLSILPTDPRMVAAVPNAGTDSKNEN